VSSGKPSETIAIKWCVTAMSGLTRLCGSIGGYVSNS
jgi:hypothetical protein